MFFYYTFLAWRYKRLSIGLDTLDKSHKMNNIKKKLLKGGVM